MGKLTFLDFIVSVHPFRWRLSASNYSSHWDQWTDYTINVGPVTVRICIPLTERSPTQPHDTPKGMSGHKNP